jgi:hypothetical protein
MNSITKTFCVKCNEYYGSEERQGMCSVCFKKYKPNEEVKKPEENKQAEVVEKPTIPEPIKESSEVKADEPVITEPEKVRPKQTNAMNCWVCNVKVGYLGFKCHCEYVFCGKHRHFSEHNCDFDYKSYDRSKLKTSNESKKVK